MPAAGRAASVLLVAFAIATCTGADSRATTGLSTAPTEDPAGEVAITIAHTPEGIALAGPNGKTLYIRTSDQNGTSTCTSGPCSRAWGALVSDPSELQIAPGITGTFGITIWRDGTQQVTHNGQPLYYYSKDRVAGEARGEGIAGVWCIAQITAGTGCGAPIAPEATFLIPGPAQRAAESAEDY
jgi:predicted lipoprotein with Yx(FWY)xxD motif